MKKLIITLVMALALTCSAAFAETKLTVQGAAAVTAEADLVMITAGASVNAASVTDAQNSANAIIATATAAMEHLGIGSEDVTTQNYYFYPTYDYSDSYGAAKIIGYQASHSLLITCRDVNRLDEVVAALTECGMTEIMDISFGVSNRSELYQQALALACDNAREKAVVLAESAGLTIVAPMTIEESGIADSVVYRAEARGDGAMGETGKINATGINSPGVSVDAHVVVTYETR